jgi:N-acetylglucosaminyldiphosphoundecaprenol N-acetyl-beta-D-mannosaminyltransferase
MTALASDRVIVAGLEIADITWAELADDLRSTVRTPAAEPHVYLAAHVNSLNHASDPAFRSVMNRSRLTYADGMSVVLLARLAGARRLARMGTTDIGVPMIEAVGESLGRPPRVAIIGGPMGLAQRAAEALAARTPCQVVLATHGFHDRYDDVLDRLDEAKADVLVVGMGMPREARWVDEHLGRLAVPVVFTCGGWLGFLVGDEQRAPVFARQAGVEWVWRLAQDPVRLGGRYARGGLVTARTAAALLSRRLRDGGTFRPVSRTPS